MQHGGKMLDMKEPKSGSGAATPSPKGSTKGTVCVDGKTLGEAYFRRIEVSRNNNAFKVKKEGTFVGITWSEVHARVVGLANGLRKQGIKPGDKVCILSNSRPEWIMIDLATMLSGAVTIPIYQSSNVEDVAFILKDCDAKLVFAEDENQCAKLVLAFAEAGMSTPVVLISGDVSKVKGLNITSFENFAPKSTEAADVEALRKTALALEPSDIATIVYTSGTTGRPKGAVLPHECFSAELRAIVTEIELRADDSTVTFLPFAHIVGRVESLLPVISGITLGFAESINAVAANITELKPTLLLSVPRIYEKIYAKIQSDVESGADYKKKIFHWAIEVGRAVARLRAQKKAIPLPLALKMKIADQLVFSKIREKLGGNIRFTISGGAPLSPDLCEIFHACGIKILEGYGLTETSAAITVNRPDDYCFATVGRPLGPTEIRIAEDGEIQVKSPVVFREYYNNPAATKEVFTSDGWFCTGDIGEFNERGFLRITDRKKEIIVTSGGKNIAPAKLENLLKSSRFISNALVYGDKQKYLVCLICLNEPEIKSWAKGQNIPFTTAEQLTKEPKVLEVIEGELKHVNSGLASYESIKKFRIVPRDFTVESGELTPSLKVKRKVVIQRFDSMIKDMY